MTTDSAISEMECSLPVDKFRFPTSHHLHAGHVDSRPSGTNSTVAATPAVRDHDGQSSGNSLEALVIQLKTPVELSGTEKVLADLSDLAQ
ncbi:hypothetical protein E4U61_004218 [Claviceps capensis]|nr:hypothetical protein E4U61_004218 [Claviceps capensis]